MINLSPLEELLKSQTQLSDDEFDPSFNQIISSIEKNDYHEAASLIQEAFQQGYLDIRCIMYYFYIYFLQEGILSFIPIFTLINLLLTEKWEQLIPIKRKEQHAQKSIHWLFSRQIKTFDYVNRSFKKGDLDPLKKYTAGVYPEIVKESVTAALRLNDTFTMLWEHTSLNDLLMHVVKWMGELTQISFQKQEEDVPEIFPIATLEEEKKEPPKPNLPSFSIPISELQPSETMILFYKKLCSFQTLIEQKQYKKAAVIADDIERRIENFNPVIHFPRLFINHYGLHAKYANKLEENRDGNSYKMLEKLFHADLDTFMEWKEK